MSQKLYKISLFLILISVVIFFFIFEIDRFLTLDNIRSQQQLLYKLL